MLPALVLLLVSGSAFLSGLVVLSVLARASARYRERYVTRSMSELGEMFLVVEARQLWALTLGVMGLLGTLGYLAANLFLGLAAAALGALVPRLVVGLYRRQRLRRFDAQLMDALEALAAALRAGLSFAQALEHVAHEGPAPLAQELGLVVREMKLGVSLEEALDNLGRRVGSEDLDLVVVSTRIARQLGGGLAELLETLSAVSRERHRLEGRIDALTSQGRLQGWVVAAMPPALGLALNLLRPDLMAPMMGHTFGYVLLGAVVLLEALGLLLIRRIVHIDV